MRIDDIYTVLNSATSINKVINDGRFVPVLMEDRTFNEMPFIELVETEVDRSEHDSTMWIRWASGIARVFVKREIDDIPTVLASIETVCNSQDQLQIVIGQPEAYNDFVWNIDISLRYYESVSKA